MSRLTLRLPDSLHRQLSDQAKQEGISLNQYIVYALTREATVAYTIRPVSDTASQKVAFDALLRASFEIRAVMNEKALSGLSADVIARLKQKLSSSE